MLISTTDWMPGHRIVAMCGLAKGCSVRALNIGDEIVARLKNTVGGEIHEYTQVFAQCREQALDRLIQDAQVLGANAVIGLRFQSAQIEDGAAELLAYGTAVRVEKEPVEKRGE